MLNANASFLAVREHDAVYEDDVDDDITPSSGGGGGGGSGAGDTLRIASADAVTLTLPVSRFAHEPAAPAASAAASAGFARVTEEHRTGEEEHVTGADAAAAVAPTVAATAAEAGQASTGSLGSGSDGVPLPVGSAGASEAGDLAVHLHSQQQ